MTAETKEEEGMEEEKGGVVTVASIIEKVLLLLSGSTVVEFGRFKGPFTGTRTGQGQGSIPESYEKGL